MKLLVLAQIPPPVHGQSVMVQALVNGLPGRGVAVHHVNLGLSRTSADVGRWRWGKIVSVFVACAQTIAARFRHGCDTLYYVPAPGKRGALYRDWIVMLFCRPFYTHLVLHWHAAGLADWLISHAGALERGLSQFFLGRADLSIVLVQTLQADAAFFFPKKIAVIPNGVADPGVPHPRLHEENRPLRVLFLSLCSEEKGLFAAATAVLEANRSTTTSSAKSNFVLHAAGPFPDAETGRRFNELCAQHPGVLTYAGPVHGAEKARLFQESDCLCLPSRYAAEGQPLVLLEAMAYDLPIIATGWRGIAATLPVETDLLPPNDPTALVHALLRFREEPPRSGDLRQHFLLHFTVEQHLARMAAALTDLHSETNSRAL